MRLRDAQAFPCPACGEECIVGFSVDAQRITCIHDQPHCKDFSSRDESEFIRWAHEKRQGRA